jgi:hypothetical protein
MHQEQFGEEIKKDFEYLTMISQWTPIIVANGNPTNVGHKWDAKSNHWTLFFENLCFFKNLVKKPLHLEF